jgi:hypothetical protein
MPNAFCPIPNEVHGSDRVIKNAIWNQFIRFVVVMIVWTTVIHSFFLTKTKRRNNMKSLQSKGGALFFIAALLLLLTGCLNNDSDSVQPIPVGYVSIYHASPDAPELDILVDNRKINFGPLSYSDHSGYLNFYTGDRELKFNASGAANALIDTVLKVEDGNAYSIFVINSVSHLETLVVRDSAQTPAAGKAMIRFVQLSPDASAMDLAITDNGGSVLFKDVAFKEATAFMEVDAASTSFEIRNSDSGNVALSANGVSLQAGGYYTVVTRGFETPPSGNTNVLSVEVL